MGRVGQEIAIGLWVLFKQQAGVLPRRQRKGLHAMFRACEQSEVI